MSDGKNACYFITHGNRGIEVNEAIPRALTASHDVVRLQVTVNLRERGLLLEEGDEEKEEEEEEEEGCC